MKFGDVDELFPKMTDEHKEILQDPMEYLNKYNQ